MSPLVSPPGPEKFFLHTPAKVQKKKLKKAEKHPELGWQVDQRDWAALDTFGAGFGHLAGAGLDQV